MDMRWHLKSHLASTLCENFGVVKGTLGNARWMQGEIWKVISCAPHMRTLVWWRGHLVMLDRWMRGEIWKVISCTPCMRTLVWWRGHLVMLDGCEVMFEKSSCVHLVWELWCGGGTLGHARWTQGEIWKVISCASHMRTLLLVWAT